MTYIPLATAILLAIAVAFATGLWGWCLNSKPIDGDEL